MKRQLAGLLCVVMLLGLLCTSAFAATPGDGNMDGGGGGMGQGTGSNSWNPGNDGVRITVVDAESGAAVSAPVDFSNRTQPGSLIYFGHVSKAEYRAGKALAPSGSAYASVKPGNAMPTIIRSSGGSNNIAAIKKYFCSEYAVRLVSDNTGVSYDNLISGKYKLLIEPLAYFKYNSVQYCFSATEAALYDQKVNGDLRSKMMSLTHQNLPLALFLETADLGFTAWSGGKSGKQSNADIINYLGVGIVRFKELPPITGEIDAPDVEYRVDTDVISSVTLTSSRDLTPDNPASVTFYIGGRSYRVNNIVIPGGDSQVVWVKWHTPATPQLMNIQVSVRGAYTAKTDFTAQIVDLNELLPPDPAATDTSPGYSAPSLPNNPQKTTANWGVWSCYWVPVWVWCDHSSEKNPNAGHWVDEGYWEFEYTGYSASLTGTMTLLPDDMVPTAQGKQMKSGYGVKTTVSTTLSTNAPSGYYTYTQTAFSVFPEFQYKTYLRLLERTSGGRNPKFTFKVNEFSTLDRKVHFSPVWFPDRTQYTIYTQVWDTWTPDGMLSVNMSDAVFINGSLFDDWYTNRE